MNGMMLQRSLMYLEIVEIGCDIKIETRIYLYISFQNDEQHRQSIKDMQKLFEKI